MGIGCFGNWLVWVRILLPVYKGSNYFQVYTLRIESRLSKWPLSQNSINIFYTPMPLYPFCSHEKFEDTIQGVMRSRKQKIMEILVKYRAFPFFVKFNHNSELYYKIRGYQNEVIASERRYCCNNFFLISSLNLIFFISQTLLDSFIKGNRISPKFRGLLMKPINFQ